MTLESITSGALSSPHGFFTRKGGASSGLFSSLNCGHGSSDQSDMVTINRSRIANEMDVPDENLVSVHQHHSALVATVTSTNPSDKADAMVTTTPGIALGILTADCQPVLFEDTTVGVIGAAHAGWKGAMNGVLEATLDAMVALGAARETTKAVIGPSISQRAYEVGPEFLDTFVDDDPDNTRFFANGNGDRYHFDLPGFGLHRLRAAGIGQAEWCGHCTYSDPDRFYSYRRSIHKKQADYGRLLSAIRL